MAWVFALFAVIGVVQQFIGTVLVARFVARTEIVPEVLPPFAAWSR
jgi:hypothetical protein